MQNRKGKLKYSSFPFGAYALLLVIIAVFLVSTNGTVSPTHLLNIARSAAPLGIVAIGQTIALLVGGIDLSVGATISMVNLVCASIMNGSEGKIGSAVIVSLLLCVIIGGLNGLIITKFKMQPFLVTLAMSIIIEGGYYIYTQGIPSGKITESFRFIAEGWLGGIPVAVIIWGIIWIVLSVILHKSIYGRKLYYTGSNPIMAKMSGYRSDIIVILQSLMTIFGISDAGEYLSQGLVIAVMVAINQWQLKRNQ